MSEGMEMTIGFEEEAPTTDEEVRAAIERSFDGGLAFSLLGLYSIGRSEGMSVPEAYRNALLVFVKPEVDDVRV